MRVVRLGVLDQPHGLKPTAAIWTSEAPDWASLDPAIVKREKDVLDAWCAPGTTLTTGRARGAKDDSQ